MPPGWPCRIWPRTSTGCSTAPRPTPWAIRPRLPTRAGPAQGPRPRRPGVRHQPRQHRPARPTRGRQNPPRRCPGRRGLLGRLLDLLHQPRRKPSANSAPPSRPGGSPRNSRPTYGRPCSSDEVGYLPLDRAAANMVFQLISRRYERGSVILTSNPADAAGGELVEHGVGGQLGVEHQ